MTSAVNQGTAKDIKQDIKQQPTLKQESQMDVSPAVLRQDAEMKIYIVQWFWFIHNTWEKKMFVTVDENATAGALIAQLQALSEWMPRVQVQVCVSSISSDGSQADICSLDHSTKLRDRGFKNGSVIAVISPGSNLSLTGSMNFCLVG